MNDGFGGPAAPDGRLGRRLLAVAAIGCGLYLLLAVVGAVIAYSPVPFWDMWDGYLGSYRRIVEGDAKAWLAQHNEHRIFLARVLFWIDLAWFRGQGAFLIAANYALGAFSAFLLTLFLRAELKSVSTAFLLLACAVWGLSFSWIQRDNFAWGFQSQFFLAQSLPLFAFYLLARAAQRPTGSAAPFAGSLLSGLAAAGAMANGVLALPFMIPLSIALRASWPRILAIAVAAAAVVSLYFRDYTPPAHHASVVDSLLHHPIQMTVFALAYLGVPLGYFLRTGSVALAAIGGAGLIALALVAFYRDFRARTFAPHRLALYAFLLYIAATAAATAGSRLNFGLEAALAGRYATPALMAWLTVLILHARPFAALFERRARLAAAIPIGLLLAFALNQLTVFAPKPEKRFEKRVAALAIELGIADEERIGALYPHAASVLDIGRWASERNLSAFAERDIRDAREAIGAVYEAPPARACGGAGIDAVEPLEGEERFARLSGWLDGRGRRPEQILILDREGRALGAATLAPARRGEPRRFYGYGLRDALGGAATVVEVGGCSAPLDAPG